MQCLFWNVSNNIHVLPRVFHLANRFWKERLSLAEFMRACSPYQENKQTHMVWHRLCWCLLLLFKMGPPSPTHGMFEFWCHIVLHVVVFIWFCILFMFMFIRFFFWFYCGLWIYFHSIPKKTAGTKVVVFGESGIVFHTPCACHHQLGSWLCFIFQQL